MALFSRLFGVAAATALAAAALQPLGGASAFASSLPAPTTLAPNSSSADPSSPTAWQKDPILTWKPVAGATGYQVQMSRSGNWADSNQLVSLPDNGDTKVAGLAPPQMLQHGDYFWRVRATKGSAAGAWSNAAELYRGWGAAPVAAASPGADATVDWASDVSQATWRFSWSAVPDASTYEIEFSTEPTFPQPDPTQTGKQPTGSTTVDCITAHTSFTPYTSVSGKDVNVDNCDLSGFDTGNTTVYWRVRGLDDSSLAAPSGASSETLECYGVRNTPIDGPDPTTTATALGTPSSPGQECSMWSATHSVAYPTWADGDADVSAMTAPTVQMSCGPCTVTPEVRWHPVAHADTYMVTIADDAAFTSIQRTYSTPFLTLQPRDELPDYDAGNGYYVAVEACTSAVGVAEVSGCGPATVKHFRQLAPAVTGLAAAHAAGGERLTWTDMLANYPTASSAGSSALEAENYAVQVTKAGDTDFTNATTHIIDRACDRAGVTGCYQPGSNTQPGKAEMLAHLADGRYLFRVLASDVSGNLSPASAAKAFTVDTTAPVLKFTKTSGVPLGGSFQIGASEAVKGVSGTTVHVHAVAGNAAVAGTLTKGATSRSWVFTPSAALTTGQSYKLVLSAGITDAAGNAAVVGGSHARATTVADDKSSAWAFTKGWTRRAASDARHGTFVTASAGHAATVEVVGSKVNVYACKAPGYGDVSISVDGSTRAVVSLAKSFAQCGVVVWSGDLSTTAVHTVKVLVKTGTGSLDQVTVG